MAVDQELVDAAVQLARTRFAGRQWSGAAALRLEDGTVLTSTAPQAPDSAVALCHETGAICEAFKRGRRVVASVCVTAAGAGAGYGILAPCGVCQERLFAYGPDVQVAVPEPADPRRWRTLRLRDVQPHWFARVFADDVWPFDEGAPRWPCRRPERSGPACPGGRAGPVRRDRGAGGGQVRKVSIRRARSAGASKGMLWPQSSSA
ncbi:MULTISPECIES: cytidine deaminase [Streptomycetaceae]|uniref:cytidine deaminase n=1 Tax=Streptomycetaceae TaxID=2062 RepID=UPI000213FA56|nr:MULTISPECIES: cytidine deaminase [Streptomycetaceae]MYS62564.1 cytidine deaminase [Streptomyces sp. SID5468]CCB78496.1 Cytidine deaminase (modular protein) [Streptantibioticus cattleyicolor NRRL 8057 = DSM 46488]